MQAMLLIQITRSLTMRAVQAGFIILGRLCEEKTVRNSLMDDVYLGRHWDDTRIQIEVDFELRNLLALPKYYTVITGNKKEYYAIFVIHE